MEGLPAQGCDPLAVAGKGPAHLLPCAWVPQENLKDSSSLKITLPTLPLVPPRVPRPSPLLTPPRRPQNLILTHLAGREPQNPCLITLTIYLAILAA